jgi:hypothetical protein
MNDRQGKCQVRRDAGWFSVASPDAAISHDTAMGIDDRFEAVAAHRPANRAAVEDKRRRRVRWPMGMTAAATATAAAATAVAPG